MVSGEGQPDELQYVKPERQTLLRKYDIPIQHLDFAYINECKDGKELERILKILKSNEEGHYPELTKVTEERLRNVKPKSKLLREAVSVLPKNALDTASQNMLKKDLEQWTNMMQTFNKELESQKVGHIDNIPDIRHANNVTSSNNKKSNRRIKSTDYESWDKYDPDTEILKMDLEEEKQKKQAENFKNTKVKTRKIENKEFITTVEAEFEANKEKLTGNEFFKSGDYEEAIEHYTNSIKVKATPAGYTNRAISYIKIKKFEEAIADCHAALKIDSKNFKAHLRIAEGYEHINKHEEAIKHIDQAIRIDPNNAAAQKLASRLQKYRNDKGKTTRLQIVETETHSRKNCGHNSIKHNIKTKQTTDNLIPIPGTSKMSPPFCVNNENIAKLKSIPNILHLTAVDEEDECTVNHLKNRCNFVNDDLGMQTQEKSGTVDENLPRLAQSNSRGRSATTHQILLNDKGGGGEPCVTRINPEVVNVDDLNSPYTFLKAWNSVKTDRSFSRQAAILQNIDITKLDKGNI